VADELDTRRVWARTAGILLGLLIIASANKAGNLPLGFRQFDLTQLWKFQRIVHLVGLGLVVVSTVGSHIDRWAARILGTLEKWLARDRRRANLLLVVLILTYVSVYGGATFFRHRSFNSTGYDLAIQDQVVWNTAHGRLFESSIEVSNYLGDHIQPYLALLSLVYMLVPSPYVLLAFQSCVLALSAWPLYLLAQRKFNSPAIGLVVAMCCLAYPPLGLLNRFDFHSEVVIIPLLIAAYERIDAGRLKAAAVLLTLALLAKEDTGLTISALGLMVAFRYHQRRFGLTWAGIGIVYSLATLFVVIPAFRGGPSDTLERYRWLGDTPIEMLAAVALRPGFVARNVVQARQITTVLQLLAPLAFLPALSFPSLMPAILALMYNYLSQGFCQTTIYCHYMAPVIPFVIISAVLGLHSMTTGAWGSRILAWVLPQQPRACSGIGLGLGIMLLAILASWTYENPVTDNSVESPAYSIQPNAAAIRAGLGHVPDDAYLVTTNAYAPHLSHRRKLRILMYDLTFDQEVEAIFLNLKDLRWNMSCEAYHRYLEFAASSGFGCAFYRDGVLLVQRGAGASEQLQDLLDNWPGCE